MPDPRSCKNCHMYLTKEGVPSPRYILGRLFSVERPCWVQNEMDGCSKHFFERTTRFERIMKDEDA
jgi:hypothetical protein